MTQPPVQRSSGRIPQLDGWRGISISLVILSHIVGLALSAYTERIPLVHHVFFHCGELGVQIFFVISGFVITRLLVLEERENGSISIKGFYVRRFFSDSSFVLFLFAGANGCELGWLDSWKSKKHGDRGAFSG
jgi:peptidoglycan/LPS O-acetylase OafA/YrhL